MLDALWELARVPALPPKLVHQAMNEHLTILNESATRDQVREGYLTQTSKIVLLTQNLLLSQAITMADITVTPQSIDH